MVSSFFLKLNAERAAARAPATPSRPLLFLLSFRNQIRATHARAPHLPSPHLHHFARADETAGTGISVCSPGNFCDRTSRGGKRGECFLQLDLFWCALCPAKTVSWPAHHVFGLVCALRSGLRPFSLAFLSRPLRIRRIISSLLSLLGLSVDSP